MAERAGIKVARSATTSNAILTKANVAGSPEGDLTPYLSRYFDTATGPKAAAQSYQSIARELEEFPGKIVFISDVARELDAAAAGYQVLLSDRPGNHRRPEALYPRIPGFAGVFP